jgi:hypothetical protein
MLRVKFHFPLARGVAFGSVLVSVCFVVKQVNNNNDNDNNDNDNNNKK